jgi:histidinol-phosphate/aromatic aminotransferase/cobyric acid decarboxylase-like protein
MKDQQEHVITPNNPLGDATSPEEIKKRLDEGIPEDIIDIED